MRWYLEHPVDGNAVARAISVGLPPDAAPAGVVSERPQVGHVVPEADREVQSQPLSVARRSSIPGMIEDDFNEEDFKPRLSSMDV